MLLYSYDERILDEESGRAADREERLIDFQATSKVGVVDSDPDACQVITSMDPNLLPFNFICVMTLILIQIGGS